MKHLIVLLIAMVFLGGCSTKILLPYDAEPSCKRGANEGMCGSVAEIYKKTARLYHED